MLPDLLTVGYYDGRAWRFGVAEYDPYAAPKLLKPIDWGNPFWIEMQSDDLSRICGLIKRHRANRAPIILPPISLRPSR